jgi:hypothetical protein
VIVGNGEVEAAAGEVRGDPSLEEEAVVVLVIWFGLIWLRPGAYDDSRRLGRTRELLFHFLRFDPVKRHLLVTRQSHPLVVVSSSFVPLPTKPT